MASRVKSSRVSSDERARGPQEFDDVQELETSLSINEHALELCLRDQPELFYRVSKALALETSRRDAAKQALQEAEFKAELLVREQAVGQDKKITEGEVRARAYQEDDVVFAREDLQARNEVVGKLSSLKEAFQQRSYALKDLVGLYIANYYGASEQSASNAMMKDRAADAARKRMSEERRRQ